MIQAVIIDDEPKAISVIKLHASKIDDLTILDSFFDPVKAIEFLNNNLVDVIFLDINMPKLSGLEMLEELHALPIVVFTTAYEKYAVKSYEIDAVDYLLKPFNLIRFNNAIKKVKQRLETQQKKEPFFFLKDGFSTIKISFKDILFIKGSKNYLDIVTVAKTYVPRMTFKAILKKLPASEFMRVHQSYIINIQHIEKIENNQIIIKSAHIPISKKFKDVVLQQLDID